MPRELGLVSDAFLAYVCYLTPWSDRGLLEPGLVHPPIGIWRY